MTSQAEDTGTAMSEEDAGHEPKEETVSDQSSLAEFVGRRAKQAWDERRKPYYLSFIATDLAEAGVNYKPLIAPFKLREWALQAQVPGAKVVSDPLHKARVGFIPESEHFSFPQGDQQKSSNSNESVAKQRSLLHRRGNKLLQFVETISRVSAQDLEDMHIPARVLVALYEAE